MNETDEIERMTQNVQINVWKKYIDGTNTKSYMFNVDNSGITMTDDDKIFKTYTIEGKEFDLLRIQIPKDITKPIAPREIELKNPLLSDDSIDIWLMRDERLMIQNELINMNEESQITYILPSRAKVLRIRQAFELE